MQRPLVGRTDNSKLKTVVTKRDIDLFVSRLHPSTQISELRDCVTDILGEQFGDKTECVKLQSRYEELYSSYHVKVKVSVFEFANVLDMLNVADNWPDGASVCRYFKPKNGEHQTPHPSLSVCFILLCRLSLWTSLTETNK